MIIENRHFTEKNCLFCAEPTTGSSAACRVCLAQPSTFPLAIGTAAGLRGAGVGLLGKAVAIEAGHCVAPAGFHCPAADLRTAAAALETLADVFDSARWAVAAHFGGLDVLVRLLVATR